jgi:tetratricopeptide (TPR) repeat protein
VNLLTGEASTELFGGDVSPAIAHLIEQARQAPREQASAILWAASLSSPQSLSVYYLLYKLHAGLGELDQAQQAARRGLDAAAQAAGLASDWRSVKVGDADFGVPGAARFWLFTLKGLAFIHLRRGERDIAQALLEQLAQLDPGDQIGAGVVRALLQESKSA